MPRVHRTPPSTPKEASFPGEDQFVNTKRGSKTYRNSPPTMEQGPSLEDSVKNQTVFMSKLLLDVAAIKNRLDEVQRTNERIEAGMSFMNKEFEDLKVEIELLKKERRDQKVYIENLETKVQDLQHKSRSSIVEIKNIPQNDSETTESLVKILCSIGDTVGANISHSHLRDIYRLPGKLSVPRPVIAEFSTVDAKLKLLTAVRAYNRNKKHSDDRLNTSKLGFKDSPSKPVNVSERLPAYTKKLLYLASEFRRKYSFEYCWVSNGNIFLRKKQGEKHHLIRSEHCLKILESDLDTM